MVNSQPNEISSDSDIIRKYEVLEMTDFSDAFTMQIYKDENFTQLVTDQTVDVHTGDELFVDISRKNLTFDNLRFIIYSCFGKILTFFNYLSYLIFHLIIILFYIF